MLALLDIAEGETIALTRMICAGMAVSLIYHLNGPGPMTYRYTLQYTVRKQNDESDRT
jgi:hypothetical protein